MLALEKNDFSAMNLNYKTAVTERHIIYNLLASALKKFHGVAPAFLGAVHGGVGILDQCFLVVAVLGIDSNANT